MSAWRRRRQKEPLNNHHQHRCPPRLDQAQSSYFGRKGRRMRAPRMRLTSAPCGISACPVRLAAVGWLDRRNLHRTSTWPQPAHPGADGATGMEGFHSPSGPRCKRRNGAQQGHGSPWPVHRRRCRAWSRRREVWPAGDGRALRDPARTLSRAQARGRGRALRMPHRASHPQRIPGCCCCCCSAAAAAAAAAAAVTLTCPTPRPTDYDDCESRHDRQKDGRAAPAGGEYGPRRRSRTARRRRAWWGRRAGRWSGSPARGGTGRPTPGRITLLIEA